MDLYLELQETKEKLNKSIKKLRENGSNKAEAEKKYKTILRQEALKLRDSGEAIGMINLICYGIPSVAEARYERDVALTVYEANKEAINVFKLQLRLIEEQIQREYSATGQGNF